MKVTKQIAQKIEGEAELELFWENGKVIDSKIKFFSYRGMEEIIQGRPPLDALVLTPRVCGICGHAQLMAAVLALEDIYTNNNISLKISNKAKILRNVTLNCEIIQNHLKWLYFIIMPILYKIDKREFPKEKIFEALKSATTATKLIALFAGQWPHNSYMIPGGVVCDPTNVELFQAISLIDEVIVFFEKNIIQNSIENIINITNVEDLLEQNGLMKDVIQILIDHDLQDLGKAHDCFISFGNNSIFKSGKKEKAIYRNIKAKNIKEESFDFTYAKNVTYNNKFYEVGPLSRAIILKNPLAKNLHKFYQDSILSRIVIKIMEIAYLSYEVKQNLTSINLKEPSFIKPKTKIENLEGTGEGFAEAARGSLYHSLNIKNGKILKYDIITPTQWNLGNSSNKKNLSIIQKALLNLENEDIISLVFRSFDECSVCTTH